MPSASAHVEAHVAKQIEATVKAFVGIALIEQVDDIASTFLQQLLLDGVTNRLHGRPVLLSEVDFLELGIYFSESSTDPAIKSGYIRCYGRSPRQLCRCSTQRFMLHPGLPVTDNPHPQMLSFQLMLAFSRAACFVFLMAKADIRGI